MTYLIPLVAILLAEPSIQETTPEKANWTVWIADGSGPTPSRYEPAPDLLETYVDTLHAISPRNVRDWSKPGAPIERERFSREKLKITKIGKWEGFEVYDITLPEARHKSIALKDKDGRFRILYLQFESSTAEFKVKPEISKVQGRSVLSYQTVLDGSGHHPMEYFFLYDKKRKRPVDLDTSAIRASLDKHFSGHTFWEGPGLLFFRMKYSSVVYKTNEGHAIQIGPGTRVSLDLKLVGEKLVVTNEEYVPIEPSSETE